eukprot:symbB.v1.2.033960.t1/scaffold4294.1/size41801/3
MASRPRFTFPRPSRAPHLRKIDGQVSDPCQPRVPPPRILAASSSPKPSSWKSVAENADNEGLLSHASTASGSTGSLAFLSTSQESVSDSTSWNVKEEADGWQGDWQEWQSKEKSRRKRPRANGPLTESIGMSFAGLPPKQAVVSFLCRYYGRDIIKNVEVKYSVTGCDEDGWACVLTTIFLEGVQHHGVGSTQKAAEIAAAEAFLSHSQVEEVRKLIIQFWVSFASFHNHAEVRTTVADHGLEVKQYVARSGFVEALDMVALQSHQGQQEPEIDLELGALPAATIEWPKQEELRNMMSEKLLLAADDGRQKTIVANNMKAPGHRDKIALILEEFNKLPRKLKELTAAQRSHEEPEPPISSPNGEDVGPVEEDLQDVRARKQKALSPYLPAIIEDEVLRNPELLWPLQLDMDDEPKRNSRRSSGDLVPLRAEEPSGKVKERKALKENEQMEAEAQPASLGV